MVFSRLLSGNINNHLVNIRKWQYLMPASSRIASTKGHKKTCPMQDSKAGDPKKLVRGPVPPVRMVFIPEPYFTFFKPKTGITGPYIFMFVMANYLLSKEIYVLEHEYYSGLSIFVMVAFAYKQFGNSLAAWLDSEVDKVANAWEKIRTDEINEYRQIVKTTEDAIMRAEAQKLLMAAKKENVKLQIEAITRERTMHVYKSVKGRMEYQIKRFQSEARIQQKWMIGWILENVRKSITPEFQKEAFDAAIKNLDVLAANPKPASPPPPTPSPSPK